MVAKSAIVITVADDFFYMEASPSKLKCLTNAIQRYTLDEEKKKKKRRYSKIVNSSYIYIFNLLVDRWDAKGLSNHSKIIFDALDNLVSEIASKYFQQEGRDMTKNLQDIKLSTIYWVSVLSIISCVLYLSTCEIVKTRHGLRNPNGVKLDMVNRQGGLR